MFEKPNFNAEPMMIGGKKCWHVGKDKDGKEVYYHEKGYLKIKNGKIELGQAIDAEGNFVKKPKGAEKADG